MTKSTTRKTASSRKTEKTEPKAPEPMDSAVRETSTPEVGTNHPRLCYAAKTLLAEVGMLFPETTYEESNPNGRNVSLGVTFELASLDDDAAVDLASLLRLISHDARVEDVTHDEPEQLIHVAFVNQPRVYDLRDPFGLESAYVLLAATEDDIKPETEDDPLAGGGSL